MTMMSHEPKRASRTLAVLALFQSRPNEWIDVHELAHVGGFCSWRTRISDARKVAPEGWTIQWNGDEHASAYRYQAVPLGRAAEQPVARTLFDMSPRA